MVNANEIRDGLGGVAADNLSNSLVSLSEQANSFSSDGDAIHDDADSSSSVVEGGSSVCGPIADQPTPFHAGLIRLPEGDDVYDRIKRRLVSGLGVLGEHVKIFSIHRNPFTDNMGHAKIQAFRIFAEAVGNKCHGDANIKYAWYAGPRDEISKIIDHGFGYTWKPNNDGLYGCGVYLFPDNFPMECVKNSVADGEGMRYVLLCRVILGKQEVVHPGSDQYHPSSEEFDSGVDNLLVPQKYILWNTNVNTHIMPEYIISFKAPSSMKGYVRIPDSVRKPNSPWMPIPILISELANFLSPPTIALISKYHRDLKENKISRSELVHRVRHIVGDELLIVIIKSYRAKEL